MMFLSPPIVEAIIMKTPIKIQACNGQKIKNFNSFLRNYLQVFLSVLIIYIYILR